mgnify:CR=1 FL=1
MPFQQSGRFVIQIFPKGYQQKKKSTLCALLKLNHSDWWWLCRWLSRCISPCAAGKKKIKKKKKNSSRSLITVKTSCGQLYRALLWTQWYLPITASIKSQAMYWWIQGSTPRFLFSSFSVYFGWIRQLCSKLLYLYLSLRPGGQLATGRATDTSQVQPRWLLF